MSHPSTPPTSTLSQLPTPASLSQLCQKQQKLIEMLQKQVHTLKDVILSMENDIKQF